MGQFDYNTILQSLETPAITQALRIINEYKGRQSAFEILRPDVFRRLVEVAKIQSVGASNRIENIATTDKRLRDLVNEKTVPHNRDEREIAGYRYVLNLIHENHDVIPVTPNVILQLHRDLYRYDNRSFAGKWKDSDNVVAERSETGELVVRFRPTSAAATPSAIERICNEYENQIERAQYDPLLVSLVFLFDFVSIHPFNDGNGRMDRLLTLLLLYREGYTVGKYVSLESEIERSKETYYEALAASSEGWAQGINDYAPFTSYMLGVLLACYRELDSRVMEATQTTNNEEILRAYFDNLLGSVTKNEIVDAHPSMSKRTIERLLKKLQDEGVVEKVGAARATEYRRVEYGSSQGIADQQQQQDVRNEGTNIIAGFYEKTDVKSQESCDISYEELHELAEREHAENELDRSDWEKAKAEFESDPVTISAETIARKYL